MKKKITLWLILCLLSIVGHNVLAVTAVPWPVEKTQPDGSTITVLLRGDEKVHWMESLDGYTLMYDTQRYIVYATQDADNNMVPSTVRLSATSVAPSGVEKGLLYSPVQTRMMQQIWDVADDDTPLRALPTGSRKALCVLMSFTNKAFTKSNAELETLFNQVGLYPADGSIKGSVRDFYRENSYGQLDLTVTIVGPYLASNTTSYFATHEQEFAAQAINEAFNDGVDLTEFAVDVNGTLTLETFHILYAGYGDEAIDNGQQIWAHKYQLSPSLTLGGVRVSVYSCSPELRGSNGNNTTYIGVICHELNHVFGAPDYYDTNYASGGQFSGAGNWCLMSSGSWNNGGLQPGHMNMLQKILYNWVTPVELTSYTEVTGMPNSAMNAVAYKISANSNGEQYILENRQQTGFDSSLPGHGLLIWHAHQNAVNGNANNTSHPQQFYPVVASSRYQIPTSTPATYGLVNSSGAPFPGSSEKQSFTSKTTPAMFTWVDTQPIAKPLTEITETGDLISFKFMDGPSTPVLNLTATESSGNVTLNWTAPTHPDVEGYKVFRDGLLIYTINSAATTTYTQIGVTNGTYTYGVTAFYEFTESAPATATITVTSGSATYSLPPIDLKGRTSLDKAWLNWTRPFNAGWMTIAGNVSNAWNFDVITPTAFFAGTLWGPEQLKGMDGYEITQIQFYRYDTNVASTNRLQVWEIDGAGVPVLVVDEPFAGTMSEGLKTVPLTAPYYTIDATKEYIIGVEIVDRGVSTAYPLITDDGPIVPGRNLLYIDGDWYLFEDVGFEENFFTSVYLRSGNPSPPSPDITLDGSAKKVVSALDNTKTRSGSLSFNKTTITKPVEDIISYIAPAVVQYNIFRDGVYIGNTTTPTFEDTGLTSGTTYCYCVSTEYANTYVSEGVCIELKTLSPVNPFNPPENVIARSAGDDITLTWDAPYTGGDETYVTDVAAPSMTTAAVAVLTEAIRFDYNDLKRMEGYELTKVTFRQANSTVGRSYRIKVWSGGNGSTPGTLIYDEPAAFVNNATTTITLNAPVPINIYEDLWVGVEITRTAATGNNVSPRYTTGGVNGKSNMYHNGTTWSTSTTTSGGVTTNNIWPITVTIEPSSITPVTGYNISRNGTPLTNVSATTFSYLDQGLQPGNYNYCVTALYGANQSDAACSSATAEVPLNPYKPAQNLEARLNVNNVTLNWEPPFSSGIIGYSSGVIDNAYTLSDDLYMATRFTKSDLKMLRGMQLTDITFATYPTAAANFTPANVRVTLCVWTGGDINGPEALVYTQPVPTYALGWNTIPLTTPIEINVYEELWIGIRTEKLTTATIYPCTISDGDGSIGKGDMIYLEGMWQSFSEYASIDINWTLFGHVAQILYPSPPIILSPISYSTTDNGNVDMSVLISSAGSKANLDGSNSPLKFNFPDVNLTLGYSNPSQYAITRNGALLATVPNTQLTYTDILTQTDVYTYCVTALYNAGVNESEPICTDITFVSECDAQPQNLTITLTDNKVELDWQFTPAANYERIYFSEDFSAGIPATWNNVDADGDTYLWTAYAGVGADGNPGLVYSASNNGTVALTPDNWLISPAITLPENSQLNFYVKPFDPGFPDDHYGVFISTVGNTVGDFNPLSPIYSETLQAPDTWKKRTIDLSAYAGQTVYIAFRHYDCTDQNVMFLDDISITCPLFNIYENGSLIDQVSDTHYEKFLTDGGTYEYCVTFEGAYCESASVCDDVTFSLTSVFTPSPTQLRFDAAGGNDDFTLSFASPPMLTYYLGFGLDFYVSTPAFITSWTSLSYLYTFTTAANTSGVALEDTIRIWFGTATSTFNDLNGYKIVALQKSLLLPAMLDYSLANTTYTGAGQSVSVTLNAAYSGLGAITVLYDGSATLPVNAGTYVVSITALEGANFDAVTTPIVLGSITIDPAPLTIRPDDVTRPYGAPNPPFTATFTGLQGADTQGSITGLTMTTTAIQASMPGNYPITASGGANPNYTITYVDGVLTVGQMSQTITFPTFPVLFVGDILHPSAYSSVGLPITYSSSDPTIAEVLTNGVIVALKSGSVRITASSAGNQYYNPANASQILVVKDKVVDPGTQDDPGVGSEFIDVSQSIMVYPNPVSKSTPVYVNANVDEALLVGAVITVYNESGSLVKNVQVTGKQTKVDLSVDAGTYLFVLKGKDGIIKTLKVIVK